MHEVTFINYPAASMDMDDMDADGTKFRLPEYILGLDLGQAQDPTALSIGNYTLRDTQSKPMNPSGNLQRDKLEYHARHLERYALGTSYPLIVEQITDRIAKSDDLRDNCVLALDATGVGRPVVDLFAQAKNKGNLRVEKLVAVTITGGDAESSEFLNGVEYFRVPKRNLVSTAQVMLQARRLRVISKEPMASVLVDELKNFQVKISENAHDSYGAWREGTHDDLLLAVAIMVWYAENHHRNLWVWA